jgi:F-type H+-transporting ATPase subunit epsilon
MNERNETGMPAATMAIEVLVPFRTFIRREMVLKIVAQTPKGSYGFLPNRLDCVAPLVPGVLMYATEADGEVYIAVDQGILVKTGRNVVVSVRHAIGGVDLGKLQAAVEDEFLDLDERERSLRGSLAKLESSLIRKYAEFHHE